MEDLILKTKLVSIQELEGLDKPNENCLRVYKPVDSDSFILQIRTHKGTEVLSRGAKRNMVAGVSLTPPELRKVLLYMEECERN